LDHAAEGQLDAKPLTGLAATTVLVGVARNPSSLPKLLPSLPSPSPPLSPLPSLAEALKPLLPLGGFLPFWALLSSLNKWRHHTGSPFTHTAFGPSSYNSRLDPAIPSPLFPATFSRCPMDFVIFVGVTAEEEEEEEGEEEAAPL
jgi:hypothetical protein